MAHSLKIYHMQQSLCMVSMYAQNKRNSCSADHAKELLNDILFFFLQTEISLPILPLSSDLRSLLR